MKNNANLIPNTLIDWHFQSLPKSNEKTSILYEAFNLTPVLLQQKGAILEASQYANLVKKSIQLFDDESFTSLNTPLKQGAFQMMTHACITSTTLEHALKRMTQYYKIVSNELTWTFETDDKNIHVYFDLSDHSNKKADYFTAFMMSSIWRWLCWMIAKPIFLEKVEFCFTSPSISKEISQVFNSPITFNQKQNKISFSRVYLDQPIKQSPSSLLKFLKQTPENLFSHYKTNLSVKSQVKEHLEAQSTIQKSTLNSVAKTFFCSEQTLMRKLRKEGTSFKEIKNKICQNKACRLLIQTDKTIEQIAFTLGFIDTSTFYKNFKRWSQHTPIQYRQLEQRK